VNIDKNIIKKNNFSLKVNWCTFKCWCSVVVLLVC